MSNSSLLMASLNRGVFKTVIYLVLGVLSTEKLLSQTPTLPTRTIWTIADGNWTDNNIWEDGVNGPKRIPNSTD